MSTVPPDPNDILLDAIEEFGDLAMHIQISGPVTYALSYNDIERLTNSFMETVKRSVQWPPSTPQ